MTIQWFPGHMTRAKREMEEKLKQVDCVIELRDARCPYSSVNPLLLDLAKQMPRVIVLTKKDMADSKEVDKWVKHLKADEVEVISLDVLHDNTRQRVVDAVMVAMTTKLERWKRKGIRPRKLKAMIVGIPNVGKSTLINQLAKKKLMVSANRPGVTMSLKWANVHPQLDVLDTPGVLWPKFEDEKVGINLALAGSIAEKVIPSDELALIAFNYLNTRYPDYIENRYQIKTDQINDLYLQISKLRHLVKADDYRLNEARDLFLRELKTGVLGPLCFEYVEDLAGE